jgi:RimJ/RimL family protein N-acetyltransferase
MTTTTGTTTATESLHRPGAWLDAVSYALLADEWNPARP